MKRREREWLLGPIWGVLGYGALLGVPACGGEAQSPGGADPGGGVPDHGESSGGTSGALAPASPSGPEVAGPGEPVVTGITDTFGGEAPAGMTGTGGAASVSVWGGANGEPGVAVWQRGGASMRVQPAVPVECAGIAGSTPSDSAPQLSLPTEDALAFCQNPLLDTQWGAIGVCLPAPPPGETCQRAYAYESVASLWDCGRGQVANYVCGPRLAQPDGAGCAGTECCYVFHGDCVLGRPFMVEGRARLARTVQGDHWLLSPPARATPDVASLDSDTRRALSDAYAKDALMEHASVASFARFVLECLALGAPADIVLAAQQALADEIEHAANGFALASAYAGVALGPSALDVSNALSERVTVVECARRTFREGCIAETVSAALIHAAADAASDAAVKRVLGRTREDERRHAVLAWRFVNWAMEREGELLRAVIAEEMRCAHDHIGFGALTSLPGDAAALRAHGYLSEAERRRIALETLEHVVSPSAHLLMRGHSAQTARRRAAPAGQRNDAALA